MCICCWLITYKSNLIIFISTGIYKQLFGMHERLYWHIDHCSGRMLKEMLRVFLCALLRPVTAKGITYRNLNPEHLMNSTSAKHPENIFPFCCYKFCQRDSTSLLFISHAESIKPSSQLPPFHTHMLVWNLVSLKCLHDLIILPEVENQLNNFRCMIYKKSWNPNHLVQVYCMPNSVFHQYLFKFDHSKNS